MPPPIGQTEAERGKKLEGRLLALVAMMVGLPIVLLFLLVLIFFYRGRSASATARAAPVPSSTNTTNLALSYQWRRDSATNTGLQLRWVVRVEETNAAAAEVFALEDRGRKETLRLLPEVILDENDIDGASIQSGPGSPGLSVVLTDEGKRKFAAVTAANVGRRLAIVSRGRVLSAPVIRTAISTRELTISGDFSEEQLHQLSETLNHRKLPDQQGP